MPEPAETGQEDSLQPPTWWRLGLTSAERRAADLATEPDWAREVRDALAGTGPDPLAGVPIPGDLGAFALPLRPLVGRARGRLAAASSAAGGAAGPVLAPRLLDRFAADLSDRLARLVARTLVLELHLARRRGTLTGDTGADRFADFVRRLSDAPRLAALLRDYPVLARLVAQTCRREVDAYAELIGRFARDRARIVAALLDGADPGALVSVATGSGDRHDGGRSVAVLRFASGAAVVYKPRSVAMLAHFADLVDWLNRAVPSLGLAAVRALPAAGYGWAAFVPQLPCQDRAAVRRFYRRQGALVALLHVTRGTDVHFENVVASADQPIVVDVETLFHPDIAPESLTGPDPAAAALAGSVDRTGLLPTLLFGEHAVADVSGLGGEPGGVFPLEAVGWADAGTDTMRLVRGPVPFPATGNRPYLHGAPVDPGAYRTAMLAGFRAGYAALVAHRDSLSAVLSAFGADLARVVPRPTRLYADLLDDSTHPDLMADADVRDALLRRLAEHPAAVPAADLPPDALVGQEVAQLWAGDVPVLCTTPDSVAITGGLRRIGTLPRSGLDAAGARIDGLGDADRRAQEWVIAAAFASRCPPPGHRAAAPRAAPVPAAVAAPGPLRGRAIERAVGIADRLLRDALRSGDRINWLGLETLDGVHWRAMPMGAGLATGYSGVALFLAELAVITEQPRYAAAARAALRPIPALLAALRAAPEQAAAVGPGAWHGVGGIGYALARLGRLLDDAVPEQWLADACAVHALSVPALSVPALSVPALSVDAVSAGLVEPLDGVAGDQLGVAAGVAGGLAAAVAVHRLTDSPAAADLAAALAGHLTRVRAHRPAADGRQSGRRAGFLWGDDGIDWALAGYAARFGQPPAAFGPAGEPPRPDAVPAAAAADHGWCSGRAGRLAGWVCAAGARERAPSAPVRDWSNEMAGCAPLADASLCHGEFGIVEALGVIAGAGCVSGGGDAQRDAYLRRAAAATEALGGRGPRCGTPLGVPTPGLLTGLAGIGYGLLRVAEPRQVPSVLLLGTQPPGDRRPAARVGRGHRGPPMISPR